MIAMRFGEKKYLGLVILLMLFNSFAIGLIQIPFATIPYSDVNNTTDIGSLPEEVKNTLESQDNVEKISSDIFQDITGVDTSSLIYKYKPEELQRAYDLYDFLITQAQNLTDKGFMTHLDLTGGNNDTSRSTSAAAFTILASLELITANLSNPTILNETIQIANFMIRNLRDSVNKTNYYAFYTNISNDLTELSNNVNVSDNALAIIALLRLYQYEKNTTYLSIANDSLTFINDILWDDIYQGYYSSNQTIGGNKIVYDNLLAVLANIEATLVDEYHFFDYEAKINAKKRAEQILNNVIGNLYNDTALQGIAEYSNRYWNVSTINNESLTIGLASYTFMSYYTNYGNQTFLDVSENLSRFMDLELFDTKRGLFNASSSSTQKLLEANLWIMLSKLQLYEINNNISYYLEAIQLNNNLTNTFYNDTENSYDYIIDFEGTNITLKYTYANALAISTNLKFKYVDFLLSRVNLSLSILLNYFYYNHLFEEITARDYEMIGGEFLTSNFYLISTILKLNEIFNNTNLIEIVNQTYDKLYNYYYDETNDTFVTKFSSTSSSNYTTTQGVSQALISLIDLYKVVNNVTLKTTIDNTWDFLNSTLWDDIYQGYFKNINKSVINYEKNAVSNFLAVWANLEVANLSDLSEDIRNSSRDMANQTLRILIEKLWDNETFGFYYNSSRDWDNLSRINDECKNGYLNFLAILTLLKYIEYYPSDVNIADYEVIINQTIHFLMNYLWDDVMNSFYQSSNHNGTYIASYDKLTSINSWAVRAFLELYDKTNNETYLILTRKILDYLNLYNWDYEFGSYYEVSDRNGTISEEVNTYKYVSTNALMIDVLVRMAKLDKNLEIEPLTQLFIDEKYLNNGFQTFTANLTAYAINGTKLSDSNISISTSGFYKTLSGYNLYGLGKIYELNKSADNYNVTIDVSRYQTKSILTINLDNSNFAYKFETYTFYRLFEEYASRAFSLTNALNLLFKESDSYGYLPFAGSGNATKYTLDSLQAINSMIEFMQVTGLQTSVNASSITLLSTPIDQILFTEYINKTFNYVYENLRISNTNYTGFAHYRNVTGSYNSNITRVIDNSYAILIALKMYEITNNSYYLEIANETWQYVNMTFWDNSSYGFRSNNITSYISNKNLNDNLYAILACLELSNISILNSIIKTQSLEMANITLSKITLNLNDSIHNGFYSSFNGSTWIPEINISNAKTCIDNALIINILLKYSDLNDINATDYKILANSTFEYLYNYLWDDEYFAFFTYTNDTYYNNTFKYLEPNVRAILALTELYKRYNNYTYYMIAEQVIFYLNTYMYSSILGYGSYINATSRYGYQSVTGSTTDLSSMHLVISALLQLHLIRRNLDSLTYSNYTISYVTPGKIEDILTVTFQLFDSNNQPVQNAQIYAILTKDTRYYQPINFTNIYSNYYQVKFDVGYTMDTFTIKFLSFGQNLDYRSKEGQYSHKRDVPIYLQIAYDTMNYLITTYWDAFSEYNNSFHRSSTNTNKTSYDNFLLIQSLLSINETFGSLLYSVNKYHNNTYDSYIDKILEFQNQYLVSNSVNNTERLVTGYIQEVTGGATTKSNYTRVVDNAMAVITYLELFNKTGNEEYLNKANDTWIYLNYTFQDTVNGGFKSTNKTTANSSRTAFDNFMVVLACLKMNSTLNISNTIRGNASELALLTFDKINSSFWDTNVSHAGGYLSGATIFEEGGDWFINGTFKRTDVNALAAIVSLELYNQTNNEIYYNWSKEIINILETKLWDTNNSGYYYELLENFSLRYDENITQKAFESQSWVIMMYTKMFEASNYNSSYYYRAEEIMRFCNDYFINNFFYQNNLYYEGYRDRVNYQNYPAGDITSDDNGWAIIALIDLFEVANNTFWTENTTPWLIDNTTFESANFLVPNGEWMNISSLIFYNETEFQNYSSVKITIIGGYPTDGLSDISLIDEYNATLNSENSSFIVDLVNLTDTQDIFVSIYAVNDSKPAHWKLYYIERIETSIEYYYLDNVLYPISPVAIKEDQQMENYYNLWPGFILGQDRFTINVTFGSEDTNTLGYPTTTIEDARVNFEVLFPDGKVYINRSVYTDENGIATISFGPPGIDDTYLGLYNVTITATKGQTKNAYTTFYKSSNSTMQLRIDYGMEVYDFISLTDDQVAQGDLLQLNLTLTNTRKAAANITITLYGDAYNTTILNDYNLEIGLTTIQINVRVFDIASITTHNVWVNLTWGETLVNYQTTSRLRSYIPINIISSINSTSLAIPEEISEDDIRYAIFKVKNNKLLMNTTFTIELFSSNLQYSKIIGNLTQEEYNYFYIPIKINVGGIYSQVSGEFQLKWVNFSETFSFNIQLKPALVVNTLNIPSTPQQFQLCYVNLKLTNYRTVPIDYYVVYTIDGVPQAVKYTINAYETMQIKYPFYASAEIGRHDIYVQVYKYEISQENLVFNQVNQYYVTFSIEFILLAFVVPFIAIIISVFLLLRKFHKMEDEFEKKKVQTVYDEKKPKRKITNTSNE
ncbi:MAG: hypothetical protein EAX96_05440 [Candidatus Lokiarchaeota archaeon]|nr:hypothetical protein [Candidatus Lokiarchaeota archaeon]